MRIENFVRFGDIDMTCVCMRAYGHSPKCVLVSSLVGAAAALGSAVYSGVKSSQKNRAAMSDLEAQHASDQAWYNRRYNEDYLDTAAGMNLLRQAKDLANNNWKHAHGAAAVGGGTDAATAMAKESGNKIIGNTMSNIASHDVSRKDSVDNMNRQNERNYTAQKVATLKSQANDIAEMGARVSDSMFKAGAAFDGFNSASTASNVEKTAGNLAYAGKTGSGDDFLSGLNGEG